MSKTNQCYVPCILNPIMSNGSIDDVYAAVKEITDLVMWAFQTGRIKFPSDLIIHYSSNFLLAKNANCYAVANIITKENAPKPLKFLPIFCTPTLNLPSKILETVKPWEEIYTGKKDSVEKFHQFSQLKVRGKIEILRTVLEALQVDKFEIPLGDNPLENKQVFLAMIFAYTTGLCPAFLPFYEDGSYNGITMYKTSNSIVFELPSNA